MVVGAAIALLFFRGGDLPSASSQSGNYHDQDDTEQGEHRDGSGSSGDGDISSGVPGRDHDGQEGGDGNGDGREAETDDEDDYVVLTEAEVKELLHCSCST